MKSELLKSVFKDEPGHTNWLILRYKTELEKFPNGSVFKRKIGNHEYLYLNYREDKKVISKFLGMQKIFRFMNLHKN